MDHDAVHVLIASPLEADLAARIAAVDPRLTVLYEPGLLPVPRYPADHSGTPRDLCGGPSPVVGLAAAGRHQL